MPGHSSACLDSLSLLSSLLLPLRVLLLPAVPAVLCMTMFGRHLSLDAQLPLQVCKHGVGVFETHRVAAARLLQGSAPQRLALAVPLAPHPQHVGQITHIGFVSCMHALSPISL